jgi:hypothetical protein
VNYTIIGQLHGQVKTVYPNGSTSRKIVESYRCVTTTLVLTVTLTLTSNPNNPNQVLRCVYGRTYEIDIYFERGDDVPLHLRNASVSIMEYLLSSRLLFFSPYPCNSSLGYISLSLSIIGVQQVIIVIVFRLASCSPSWIVWCLSMCAILHTNHKKRIGIALIRVHRQKCRSKGAT